MKKIMKFIIYHSQSSIPYQLHLANFNLFYLNTQILVIKLPIPTNIILIIFLKINEAKYLHFLIHKLNLVLISTSKNF